MDELSELSPFQGQAQGQEEQDRLLQPPAALEQGAEEAEEAAEAPGAALVADGMDETEAGAGAAAPAVVFTPTPMLIVLPSAVDPAAAPADPVEAPPVEPPPPPQQHQHDLTAAVPSIGAADIFNSMSSNSSSSFSYSISCPTPSMPAPAPAPLAQPRRVSVQLPLTLQLAYEAPRVSDTPPVSERGAHGLYTRQVHWWQAHRQAVRACVFCHCVWGRKGKDRGGLHPVDAPTIPPPADSCLFPSTTDIPLPCPPQKPQATLRALTEAKEREQQEALECTFRPQSFATQTYRPPQDRPRHRQHACPHPAASARPPMTVPVAAAATTTTATAAAVSHRSASSLSPQRQRGGVTDVDMSPRT